LRHPDLNGVDGIGTIAWEIETKEKASPIAPLTTMDSLVRAKSADK
jgi:hypothetical protein